MARSELGTWFKLYASTLEDTAHFTDPQFRAYVGVLCTAARGQGELPKLRPLKALFGSAEIDFLVEEGRVTVTEDNAVTVTGWERYQTPKDRTNADRQRRFRERARGSPESSAPTYQQPVDNAVTVTFLPSSSSIYEEKNEEKTEHSIPSADFDALDRYYELTGAFPWGRNPGRWIAELQSTHGIPNVVAALEVEHRDDPAVKTLLGRVAARLERQKFRVEEARKKEPKAVDPVQEELRAALAASGRYDEPEPAVGDPAAGRAAFEALRGKLGASHRPAKVVRSKPNGSGPAEGPDPALTVDEGSGSRVDGGDVLPGVESGERAPSPPGRPGAAVVPPPNRARSEPGRSNEAPTDGATEGAQG